jgi:hypothetical protein
VIPIRPSPTNLDGLLRRFEIVAAKVADRISDSGQDPSAVLNGRRSEFRLRLMTVPGSHPLYWSIDLRKALGTSRTDDEIADELFRLWRLQAEIDEALARLDSVPGENEAVQHEGIAILTSVWGIRERDARALLWASGMSHEAASDAWLEAGHQLARGANAAEPFPRAARLALALKIARSRE